MDNPKGQCNLGLCYLRGAGCNQNTELGFQWISLAADSGLPIVFQMLQEEGLDVPRLIDGYKKARRLWTTAAGDRFGRNFGRIFSELIKSIVALPPSVQLGKCESDANVCVG